MEYTWILKNICNVNTPLTVCYASVIPEVYMGIFLPKAAGMQEIALCYEDVKTPHTRHQVKYTQLTRLIKLGVLALREVETPVNFIQKILLHHCMEDDGDEEIEEDGGTVLPSIMVQRHLSFW